MYEFDSLANLLTALTVLYLIVASVEFAIKAFSVPSKSNESTITHITMTGANKSMVCHGQVTPTDYYGACDTVHSGFTFGFYI